MASAQDIAVTGATGGQSEDRLHHDLSVALIMAGGEHDHHIYATTGARALSLDETAAC